MAELYVPLHDIAPKLEKQVSGKKIIDAFRLREILHGEVKDIQGEAYELPIQPDIWVNAGEHNVAAMYVCMFWEMHLIYHQDNR